jgi:hypothetical protein
VNTGKPLVEQANEALAADLFPLFVAEGSSDQKLSKIQHSAYLHHSYKSFCTVCSQGTKTALFIYGHSLADTDRHILDRIGRGKLAHLFVSIFGDPDDARNKGIRAAAERITVRRPRLRSSSISTMQRRPRFGVSRTRRFNPAITSLTGLPPCTNTTGVTIGMSRKGFSASKALLFRLQ